MWWWRRRLNEDGETAATDCVHALAQSSLPASSDSDSDGGSPQRRVTNRRPTAANHRTAGGDSREDRVPPPDPLWRWYGAMALAAGGGGGGGGAAAASSGSGSGSASYDDEESSSDPLQASISRSAWNCLPPSSSEAASGCAWRFAPARHCASPVSIAVEVDASSSARITDTPEQPALVMIHRELGAGC